MLLSIKHARQLCLEIIDIFYPFVCSVCGNRNLKENTFIKEICCNCMSQIPIRDAKSRLVSCLEKYTALYDKYSIEANTEIMVACDYESLIKKSLIYLKFYESEYYARLLAQIISFVFYDQINEFDYIIPIPLHKKRLNDRGYNQAALIAREVAKICNISVLEDSLIRISFTKRQSELSNKESRMENLNNAFAINNEYNFNNKRIIVFDDVLTSGSTMYHALKTINNQYSKNIIVKGLVVASNRN